MAKCGDCARLLPLLPVIGVVSLSSVVLICYAIAVTHDHLPAVFPYISYTGTQQPESCIFSILFNVGAIFGCLTFIVRFKQLQLYFGCDNKHLTRTNKASLTCGIIATIGLCLVGNFQATGNIMWIRTVHWVGAGFAAGVGLANICLEAVLSWFTTVDRQYRPRIVRTKLLPAVRSLLAVLGCVSGLSFIICLLVSLDKFTGDNIKAWNPQHGGYLEHVISAGSQWALYFLIMTSVLTFVVDFRHIRLAATPILPTTHRQESVQLNSNNSSSSTKCNNNDSSSSSFIKVEFS